jgi:hypothetical protein
MTSYPPPHGGVMTSYLRCFSDVFSDVSSYVLLDMCLAHVFMTTSLAVRLLSVVLVFSYRTTMRCKNSIMVKRT